MESWSRVRSSISIGDGVLAKDRRSTALEENQGQKMRLTVTLVGRVQ